MTADARYARAAVEVRQSPVDTVPAAALAAVSAHARHVLVLLSRSPSWSSYSPHGNSLPRNSALSAFLFGSPSAIWGFLVQMWQDGSLLADTRMTALETLLGFAGRQCPRHTGRAGAMVFAFRVAGRPALRHRPRIDPNHRACTDLHHLVRHRSRLESRNGDVVGGRGSADHRLQGRDDRRYRPDQSDAHARRLEAAYLPQAHHTGVPRRHLRRPEADSRLRADRRNRRRIHVVVGGARPRDL